MSQIPEKILLSILIPTYKRVGFLGTAVERFISQIETGKLGNVVEIIISNDASKDETDRYVEDIAQKYEYIKGFNQPKNLGLSQNIEFLVKETGGEYILISGEDDLTQPGTLENIIMRIKENKPNYILINTSNIRSQDETNQEFKIVLENRLNINEDIFMENWEKDSHLLAPARNWLYLTNFLTAVVFKKKLFQSELSKALEYIRPENVWLWQAPIIIGIKKYGRLYVVADCFVLCRKNENHWGVNDPRGAHFINLFDSTEISRLIKDYMPSEYKKYKKLYAAFVMNTFMYEVKAGLGIRKFAWIAFLKNYDCFPENIQFFGMILAPKLVAHFAPGLHRLKNTLKKDDKKAIVALKKKTASVKGWTGENELMFLYRSAQEVEGWGVIVEIGSWVGRSTIWIAQGSKNGAGTKIYAIDTFEDDYSALNPEVSTLNEFKNNINKAGVADIIIPIKGASETAAKDWDKPIGFLFIDGSHEYDDVEKDFLLYSPHLIDEGRIAFHDTTPNLQTIFKKLQISGKPGPRKTVEKYIFKSREFKNIHIVGSITYATKCAKNSIFDRFRNKICRLHMLVKYAIFYLYSSLTKTPKPIKNLIKRFLLNRQ